MKRIFLPALSSLVNFGELILVVFTAPSEVKVVSGISADCSYSGKLPPVVFAWSLYDREIIHWEHWLIICILEGAICSWQHEMFKFLKWDLS